MLSQTFFTPIIVLALAAALSAPQALAKGKDRDQDEAGDAVRRGAAMPILQILKQVGPKLGEVLEIELEDEDGRLVYEIRYLTRQGRRMEALVDARTGQILETEDDD